MKKINLAVVGATGMVGRTFLKILEERNFPYDNLYLFASSRSAGTKLKCKDKEYVVEELTETSFDKGIDLALFSAGGGISKKFAPLAVSKGVTVVDNSSAWRMDENVPLIVPEVNPHDIKWHKGIIANPNCSTIQAVVALKPLHDAFNIKRIIYSTYQAVSGTGIKGIKDLEEGLRGNDTLLAYPHPIADNCLPHIDVFYDNGYTKEEIKMIEETKKIFNDNTVKVTATTVRVPVKNSHGESINIEFNNSFEINQVREILSQSPGVVLEDQIDSNIYPLARNANGSDEVHVGRVRRDFTIDHGLNLWVVADNIRKGAATNTIQIAELILKL